MKNLEKKVALVTGGSRGIGRAIALALADEGASVAITYRQAGDEAQTFVDQVTANGGKALALQSDAAIYEESQTVIDKVVEKFQRLDILVNNAGITRDKLLMRMSEEDWDTVLHTNLKSVFNFCKAACKFMISQHSGKIINITSIAGLIGNPGQANYAASKAGVIGLTKTLAKEFGSRNIQVNAVAPGIIETDMTAKLNETQRRNLLTMVPLQRLGKTEDIAALVRFLSTADADYITGQVICVDGGMVM